MEQFQWISLFGTTMVVNGIAYLSLKLLQITIMQRVQNTASSVNLAEDSVTIDPTATTTKEFCLPPFHVSLSPSENSWQIFKIHKTKWTTEADFNMDTNGSCPTIPWVIKDKGRDASRQLSWLNYFFMMFPPDVLGHIITPANAQSSKRNLNKMDVAEFLRWFGVVLLITHCEFSMRRELWVPWSHIKFLPPVELGREMGMSCQRYANI